MIKCTIVQDLLPLYVDDVVSEDTKHYVSQHLHICKACQDEYEQMTKLAYVPINTDTKLFHKLNKKWNHKKLLLIGGSILTTALICTTVFLYVFGYQTTIPYSDELILIEHQENGMLVSNYLGKSHAGVYMTEPMMVAVGGEMQSVSLIYYVKTIAESPSRNLLGRDEGSGPIRNELANSEHVDAVYYGKFDSHKLANTNEQAWEDLLQGMTLIWKK